eukprot:8153806-Karenia_brevis.AAC.1
MAVGDTPRLYTTKSEYTALYYSKAREFPFQTQEQCGVFGTQDMTRTKTFQVVLGVGSTLPWPHHNGKVTRSNWSKHQNVHFIDTLTPLWIGFVCTAGPVIDQT